MPWALVDWQIRIGSQQILRINQITGIIMVLKSTSPMPVLQSQCISGHLVGIFTQVCCQAPALAQSDTFVLPPWTRNLPSKIWAANAACENRLAVLFFLHVLFDSKQKAGTSRRP